MVIEAPLAEAGHGGEVFILGAGFSRALSEHMPLTDELGNECLARLDPKDRDRGDLPSSFSGGAFEPFMSMLAVDQPYLTDSENLRNRRIFSEVTAAIAEVLNERQELALRSEAPGWLQDLVAIWHHTQSSVVTFNYDTLVEAVAADPIGGLLNEAIVIGGSATFPWAELINYQPPEPPGLPPGGAHPLGFSTFRLLKMHGSTNWYWQANDATGLTAARRHPPGTFGAPQAYDPTETSRWWPGRTPMIIPPTASKSMYYQVPLLRELWQFARHRIAAAQHVYLLGYSIPVTDLSTREMLKSALVPHNATISIADLEPSQVSDRLADLGVRPERVSEFHEGIPELAAALAERRSARVLHELLAVSVGDPSAAIAINWGDKAYSAATGIERRGDQIVLTVDPPSPNLEQACRLRTSSEFAAVDMTALAAQGPASSLIVEASDHRSFLVAHRPFGFTWGHTDHWRLLAASRIYPR